MGEDECQNLSLPSRQRSKRATDEDPAFGGCSRRRFGRQRLGNRSVILPAQRKKAAPECAPPVLERRPADDGEEKRLQAGAAEESCPASENLQIRLLQDVFGFCPVPAAAPERPGEAFRVEPLELLFQLFRCHRRRPLFVARAGASI